MFQNLLKPEELVQDELLTKVVSEGYTIISRDGKRSSYAL